MSRLVSGREVVLSYLTVPGAPTPPDMVSVGAAGGFDGVTVRLVSSPDAAVSGAEREPAVHVAETLARVGQTGVAVAEVEYVLLAPSTAVARLVPLLEAAGALGARRLTVMGDDDDESRMAERLAELCEAAAAYGVSPALEFAAYTAIPTLEAAWRIVSRANHPNAALAVDTHHLRRSGGDLDELGRVVAAAPQRFPVVHVSDAPRQAPEGTAALALESRTNRLLPGDGELGPLMVVTRLPPDATVHVEAPVAAHAGLAPECAARRAARAVQAMFS